MLKDITGTLLVPGNGGKDCPGNGLHKDAQGNVIECCCEECDHWIDCFGDAQERMVQMLCPGTWKQSTGTFF